MPIVTSHQTQTQASSYRPDVKVDTTIPADRFDVTLSRAVQVNGVWYRPSHRRLIVDQATLTAMGNAVASSTAAG